MRHTQFDVKQTSQRAYTDFGPLPWSLQFLKLKSRQEDNLTEDIMQCIVEHTYPRNVINFRQCAQDGFRLKSRTDSWYKEEQRSVLCLASCFHFVEVLLPFLSPVFDLAK